MPSIGVDVSKDYIDVAHGSEVTRVKRSKPELAAAFESLSKDSRLAVEATGRYHRVVVEAAAEAGLQARVVDPFVFSLYRRSASPRAKTDRIDAQILQRYAEREWDSLPERPRCSEDMQRLKDLLELRETQVKLRVAWEQSMSECRALPEDCAAGAEAMRRSILALDAQIQAIAELDPLYAVFLEMDGVGVQTAPALVWLFGANRFEDEDQVVAFVGMDVRVRESGRYVGQRKLTKRGPAFIRRLLHCGANALRRVEDLKPFFERHHKKGLKVNGVNVIAGRKILRAAHKLAQGGARYNRAKFTGSP